MRLWINRNSKYDYPLVETRITQGNGICFENNLYLENPEQHYYPLLENKPITECEIDMRFSKIDYEIKEFEFFNANNMLDIQGQLPNFYFSDSTYYFYYRGVVPLKLNCR